MSKSYFYLIETMGLGGKKKQRWYRTWKGYEKAKRKNKESKGFFLLGGKFLNPLD